MMGSDWCISSVDNKYGTLWNGKQKEYHLCLPLDKDHLTDPLFLPESRQERENNKENSREQQIHAKDFMEKGECR